MMVATRKLYFSVHFVIDSMTKYKLLKTSPLPLPSLFQAIQGPLCLGSLPIEDPRLVRMPFCHSLCSVSRNMLQVIVDPIPVVSQLLTMREPRTVPVVVSSAVNPCTKVYKTEYA